MDDLASGASKIVCKKKGLGTKTSGGRDAPLRPTGEAGPFLMGFEGWGGFTGAVFVENYVNFPLLVVLG